jgi:hypothetical protein
MYTVVQDPLSSPGSHPLVCMGLDRNLDVHVDIIININIDISHLLLSALHSPRTFYLRPPDPLPFQPVVLASYLPPIRHPRAHIFAQLPKLRKH